METKGNSFVWELWESRVDAIIDVRLQSDCDTQNKETMKTIMDWWVKVNNDKHGKNFHNKWKHFSLFVLYVDGMTGQEDLVVLANMSRLKAEKTEEHISHIHDAPL